MVKIYFDGADLVAMKKYISQVDGVTTNPSLCKKAGVMNYSLFAQQALAIADGRPVSFEVFTDDEDEMEEQALRIALWGKAVFVKIPVTNTKGESMARLIRKLSEAGVKVNVTAVFTREQVRTVARAIYSGTPAIISIFAGRIADTGVDPEPMFYEAQRVKHDKTKILWASTRELYNIKQAEKCADIITITPEYLAKLHLFGKDLAQYSLETVAQFHGDGQGVVL